MHRSALSAASVAIASLAIACLLVLGPAQARANELAHLYELALAHDASIQAATFQRAADVEARPQALAQWLPQVSAGADAVRGNPAQLQVSLTQTLWSYEAFSRLKEADAAAAAAEASLRSAQQNLILRVATAYFALLGAEDELSVDLAEREAFGALLHQAEVRQQTGVGPRSDTQQARAFYDATEEAVIDARNAVDDAQLLLAEIAGPHDAIVVPLREHIPLSYPEPASVEEWVSAAGRDNPEVRAASLRAEAAGHDVGVQRGRAFPVVQVAGTGSRLSQQAFPGTNPAAATVGVFVSWPLFQGGLVASAVRQSRALHRESQALCDSTQREAERRTRAAYRGVVSGIERVAATARAFTSGLDAVEASRRNVEFGTGTEFDLLNAQNNYYAAVRAHAQARYDYLTSLLLLKQQAGRLEPSDITALDALLVEPAP